MPPISTPTAPPLASEAPHQPSAHARSRGWVKVMVTMVRVTGARMAAPSPWTARAAMSVPDVGARPQIRLATVKTVSATRNIRRLPNRSAVRPPSSRKPA